MKITPLQQYIILGVVFFAGLVFLYYQFLLKPLNSDIVNLRTTLEQKQKDLEEAKKIVAKYVEFKKRADSVQRELEYIQNRIPKTIDRAKLMEMVNLIQDRTRIVLTNFSFSGSPTSKDSWVEIPIKLSFNSSFKGLLEFLYQINISNLLMIVRDVNISSQLDPLGIYTLKADLILNGIQAK